MKHLLSSILLGLSFVGVATLSTADAQACGGCFHEPPIVEGGEVSQVTGHRMVFSVSPQATTLWDQIQYSGSPESFAWVLPIHAPVEIGLSSDALFEALDAMTTVRVFSPTINCPPSTCPGTSSSTTYTYSMTSTEPDVTVIAQATVGPYETVQLSSADPLALEAWLDAHGYEIPAEVVPIIDAYVGEGSDFLVMKLVPGQGVDSMRPVRVTSPGAGLSLPLRMVAAGTGVMTPITLWILGEGRYEPVNFPWFGIGANELTWDWDTQSSDYAVIKQQKFEASGGKGWLVEAAEHPGTSALSDPLETVVLSDWASSGYGTDEESAAAELGADEAALYGSIDPNSFWVTRLQGQLTKDALGQDLTIGAAANQSTIDRNIVCWQTKGTPPSCPSVPDCGGTGGSTSTSPGGSGGGGGNPEEMIATGGGCAVGDAESGSVLAGVLAVLGLTALLGKRRKRL